MSSLSPDGVVGSVPGGPKVAAPPAGIGVGPSLPRLVHVVAAVGSQSGGSGCIIGHRMYQTCTTTPLADDGPRLPTVTSTCVPPTTWMAALVASHWEPFGGGSQSSDTGMYPPRGWAPSESGRLLSM